MAGVGGRNAFRVSSTASECNEPFVIQYRPLVLWRLPADVFGKQLPLNKTGCWNSKKFDLVLAVFGFYPYPFKTSCAVNRYFVPFQQSRYSVVYLL